MLYNYKKEPQNSIGIVLKPLKYLSLATTEQHQVALAHELHFRAVVFNSFSFERFGPKPPLSAVVCRGQHLPKDMVQDSTRAELHIDTKAAPLPRSDKIPSRRKQYFNRGLTTTMLFLLL